MGEPPNTRRVRLDIPEDKIGELRVLAAMSGMSMAAYCRQLALEAVAKKRIVKPEEAKK